MKTNIEQPPRHCHHRHHRHLGYHHRYRIVIITYPSIHDCHDYFNLFFRRSDSFLTVGSDRMIISFLCSAMHCAILWRCIRFRKNDHNIFPYLIDFFFKKS